MNNKSPSGTPQRRTGSILILIGILIALLGLGMRGYGIFLFFGLSFGVLIIILGITLVFRSTRPGPSVAYPSSKELPRIREPEQRIINAMYENNGILTVIEASRRTQMSTTKCERILQKLAKKNYIQMMWDEHTGIMEYALGKESEQPSESIERME